MSYETTRLRLERLLAVLDAVNSPNVPNGTTVKINKDLEAMTRRAIRKIADDAFGPNVPNGTTNKVRRIVRNAV
ncbi:MAG: hypothetical protein ACKOXK_03935 [Chakrabartia sp.]